MKSSRFASGQWARELRKAAELTEAEMGALIGITQQAVSLIERDLRRPRPQTLVRMLRVLGGEDLADAR